MSDFRAFISNCTVAGLDFTKCGSTNLRDTIDFEISGRIFSLKQHPEIAKGNFNELKGKFFASSELTIKDVSENDLVGVESDVHALCWLLSFATLSNVTFYSYAYPANLNTGRRWTTSGTLEFFRPTIEIRDGETVKSFIEHTFHNYKALENSRKLNVAIHYLLLIETSNLPTEAKLGLIFMLLENLKSTYAHTKNIPFRSGFFRKEPRPSKGKDTYSFEELLKMMFDEVGISKELDQVIIVRNEIIHSGLTELSHDAAVKLHDEIHDLCREYLLSLLGYRGEYLLYSSGSNTVARI
ncbi:hypothetical protein [Methylophilus aquaticus]|uniref:Apea-like HEPN domain-containing protein n=1 Tax=Methylophilus aquaticus TaxID=1971610 RepID=A0ABT9JS23_9PROT|nr:hypothetical protein [Methylophilus aquaticus]MDP8567350.1 hypothetical protein [Methylophilus aquaticus]